MDTLIKTWEPRFQKFAAVLLRVALGYLFFTQLWWKAPPTFGCRPDFKFTAADASGKLQRTSGLCDWVGIESVWASRPHPVFVANLDNKGNPEIAIDIGLLAKGNGAFLDGFVKPNIRWFGYAIFGMEAFIFVTMFFGLFTRLGALIAIAQSAQLWVGLSGIGNPVEWEWSYNFFVFVSLWALAYAPGRVFGLDVLLRARLLPLAEKGNRAARVLLWLT